MKIEQPEWDQADVPKPAELLRGYSLDEADLRLVAAYPGDFAAVVEQWYAWLAETPEFGDFFSDPGVLDRVKRLQGEYWQGFLSGRVDEEYIEVRRRVGETHARIGLGLDTYFAGMNMFMEIWHRQSASLEFEARDQTMHAVAKLLHLDTAIVVATYNRAFEETITAQTRSMLDMSTPVTQIWDGILLLPIVGIIDSHRASEIMNSTLAKIADTQAQIFILDISGVGVVDTAVANNLIKITKATSLMGCECTISGLSPAIAQTIVDLGIDVAGIATTATMRDALDSAFRRVGKEIRSVDDNG